MCPRFMVNNHPNIAWSNPIVIGKLGLGHATRSVERSNFQHLGLGECRGWHGLTTTDMAWSEPRVMTIPSGKHLRVQVSPMEIAMRMPPLLTGITYVDQARGKKQVPPPFVGNSVDQVFAMLVIANTRRGVANVADKEAIGDRPRRKLPGEPVSTPFLATPIPKVPIPFTIDRMARYPARTKLRTNDRAALIDLGPETLGYHRWGLTPFLMAKMRTEQAPTPSDTARFRVKGHAAGAADTIEVRHLLTPCDANPRPFVAARGYFASTFYHVVNTHD
jgi:hypothetical protein